MERIVKTSFDRVYAFKIFLMVIREGSFASAALRLNTSPSNITKEIQKLESYLGLKLFHRTTRALSLTEAGKITCTKVKHVLDVMEEIEDDVSDEVTELSGLLRVSAPKTLGKLKVAVLLADFQAMHPKLHFDIKLSDRVINPVEENIDISIRTEYKLTDSSLFVKNLGMIKRVLCASPDYLKNASPVSNISSLSKHNCLTYMNGPAVFPWIFEKDEQRHHFHFDSTFQSNDQFTLVQACKKGLGIVNTPKYLVEDDLEKGELVEVLKSWHIPSQNIFVLTHFRPSKSKKIKAIVDYLEENIHPK